MNEVVTKPSAANIRQADAEFEAKYKIPEEALRELFGQYPRNIESAQVLLKVTALNTLYSTQIPLYSARIPTIIDVAQYIVNLGIDSALNRGDDELVRKIARTESPHKAVRFYYSFATKYCCWHNPKAYPIFDSRVVEYLWHLRNLDYLHQFPQKDLWVYPKFKKIVEEFIASNDLGDFTFKEIDKFLFLQGAILLGGKEKGEEKEEEAILVPVPGQPGEMEWSVENYGSPEEAELSRKRFTEWSDPVIVTTEGEEKV